MSEPAVSIRALTKIFPGRRRLPRLWRRPPETRAVDGVDLEVAPGELVALLGPNGAGKTTLLKMVATLILPTGGEIAVAGTDVVREPDRARARLGYVLTDERSFYWRISVRENLRFFAALQGLFGREAEARIDQLARLVGLEEHLPRDFMDLSSGQRQRVAIARGLLSDPPVVLFDEATRSLDPGRASHLRRVVREVLVLRERKAVLFATHDLEEARLVADRVVLMKKGRIAAAGPWDRVAGEVSELFAEEVAPEEQELSRLLGGAGG